MKNKIKKIVTATIVSAMSLTALGVSAKSQNNTNNNEKTVQNYLISQNIEKTSAYAPNKNIGKIVETSTNNQIKHYTNGRQIQFLNNDITEAEIENNITIPQSIDGLNLFVLSTTPYVSFSNENSEFKINVKFNENNLNETKENSLNYETKEKMNTYNLKRSILLIYTSEIYNNNVNLTNETKLEINKHIETISNNNESNLDNKIDAVNSLINIIESNLLPNSMYYQKYINTNVNHMMDNSPIVEKLSETSSNQEVANKIACVISGKCSSTDNTPIETNQTKQQVIENTNNVSNETTNRTISTPSYQNNTFDNNLNNQNPAYRRNNLRHRRRNRVNPNINSNSNEIMEDKLNSRENLNNLTRNNSMQETKTIRADRTNENISQEKYTNVNNQNDINRAARMPYQSTNNFQK